MFERSSALAAPTTRSWEAKEDKWETPEEMSELGLPEALVTYMREYVDPTKKYRGF